jgi:hypothetical protein
VTGAIFNPWVSHGEDHATGVRSDLMVPPDLILAGGIMLVLLVVAMFVFNH